MKIYNILNSSKTVQNKPKVTKNRLFSLRGAGKTSYSNHTSTQCRWCVSHNGNWCPGFANSPAVAVTIYIHNLSSLIDEIMIKLTRWNFVYPNFVINTCTVYLVTLTLYKRRLCNPAPRLNPFTTAAPFTSSRRYSGWFATFLFQYWTTWASFHLSYVNNFFPFVLPTFQTFHMFSQHSKHSICYRMFYL